ncbi:MAG TPA: SCO family protein [Thermoanaerobaculia bacterium]|nr:SCO family protein [Thermoanaerobaculia bacterium]
MLPQVGFDQRLGAKLPLDLSFRDESGRSVRLGSLFGRRPVVLAFAYHTCPMLCPMVQEGLASGLKPLALAAGRDFDVVVVSIDPEDTPARAAAAKRQTLERYGRAGAAAGFHYLTGREPAIRALARAAGFRYERVPERGEYAHTAGVVVAAPDGTVARYLFGIEPAPRDLRLALVEAAAGKVGSLVDQLLLYCFHYDPSLGRYSAAIMRLLRAAAVATVLGLAGLVLLLRRREVGP